MKRRHRIKIVMAAGILAGASLSSLGQRAVQDVNLGVQREIEGASRPGPAGRMDPGRPRFLISLNGQFVPRAELDRPGSVGVNREGFALGMVLPMPRQISLTVGVEDEFSQYDFSGVDDPWLRDLFEEIQIARASIGYRRQLDDDWSLFGAADVTASREDGAAWDNSLTGGGILSLRRQVTPGFAFSLGLFARDRLEEDPLIIPVPAIDWQITERFGLRTAQGVTLDYKLGAAKKWLLDLTMRYEGREFRLSKDDALSGGVVADRRVPLFLALHYRPHPGLHVQLYGGTLIWQEFKLIDGDGEDIAVVKTDPVPLLGASGTLRF